MDWFRDHLWETWLMIAVALGVLELLSTDLILIMLAGGALLGMVVALAGAPVALQIVLALATAVGLLALIRPNMVHRLHAGPTLRTGAEALIGERGYVLEPMTHASPGRVKIGGEVWTAKPYDEDDQIEAGASVDVVSIKGATAYVLRTHQLEP
jgi:membrane protein implicated in regulation of membrane protease activity